MTEEERPGGESGQAGAAACGVLAAPAPGETLCSGTGKPPGGWKQGNGANCSDVMLFRTSGSSKIILFGYFLWMRKLIDVPRTY